MDQKTIFFEELKYKCGITVDKYVILPITHWYLRQKGPDPYQKWKLSIKTRPGQKFRIKTLYNLHKFTRIGLCLRVKIPISSEQMSKGSLKSYPDRGFLNQIRWKFRPDLYCSNVPYVHMCQQYRTSAWISEEHPQREQINIDIRKEPTEH